MFSQTLPVTTTSTYKSAGWAAIASGIIGILAAGFLIGYLVFRNQDMGLGLFIQRFHDAGVSIQFLLFIPVTFGLHRLSQQLTQGISKRALYAGVGALLFTSLSLLLIFPKIVSDAFYMLPQGIFGVWLIVANGKLSGLLARGVRWFGMVVGAGLTVVGLFFVSYVIFVSPIIAQIPAAPIEEMIKIPITPVNEFLHYFIWIGSFMGVLPLPFWTILLGWKLTQKRIAE